MTFVQSQVTRQIHSKSISPCVLRFLTHHQQPRDRIIDVMVARLLVVSESGNRVGLKTEPSAVGGASQVNSRHYQPEGGRQSTASLGHILGKIKSAQLNTFLLCKRKPVVVSFTADLTSEDFVAHHVNTVIITRNVLLKLGWTPRDIIQATHVLRTKARDDAAG